MGRDKEYRIVWATLNISMGKATSKGSAEAKMWRPIGTRLSTLAALREDMNPSVNKWMHHNTVAWSINKFRCPFKADIPPMWHIWLLYKNTVEYFDSVYLWWLAKWIPGGSQAT